jgi:hypothetical protein
MNTIYRAHEKDFTAYGYCKGPAAKPAVDLLGSFGAPAAPAVDMLGGFGGLGAWTGAVTNHRIDQQLIPTCSSALEQFRIARGAGGGAGSG